MRDTSLGRLIAPAGKRAGQVHDVPVYSVTKHAGFVRSLDYFTKQVFSRDTRGYKLVERGDFAYATIHLDEGSVGIAPERGLISPMYTVFRADESQVDPNYLIRYLKSPRALAHYEQLGRGAVHRRKAISLKALAEVPVPLPTLDEQRRIAAILDHADALRAKRRQVLAHLDDLAQAIFHDMFGDPASRAIQVEFGDVATLAGGRNLVADDASAHSEFRVLKISAVTTGRFKPEESKPLPAGYAPPPEHIVQRGDLLMSRANTTDLVGAVALVDGEPHGLVLPDKIWRFNWHDPQSEPRFFHALLSSPSMRRRISRLSSGTGGSMKNVSKSKLNRMLVPAIDVGDQRRFVAKVDAVSHIYGQQLEASRNLDVLFASLQGRAFRGEL